MTQNSVFITGISSGIGLDAAKRLTSKGFFVYGTVRSKKDETSISRLIPNNLKIYICDITNEQELEKCISDLKVDLEGNKLYALINNAGVAIPGPLNLLSDEAFFNQMNVNLLATRKVTNRVIPFLDPSLEGRLPRIIFISSISGIFAAPFNGAYCISKHALECMIDVYRRELKYLNIKVIGIQPGPIKTKIWQKSKGRFDQFAGSVYDNIVKKADKIIQNTEQSALEVSLVSDCIVNILQSNKPKLRYMIRKNKTLFKIMSYYVPSKWLDILIWKNLETKDPKKYRPV